MSKTSHEITPLTPAQQRAVATALRSGNPLLVLKAIKSNLPTDVLMTECGLSSFDTLPAAAPTSAAPSAVVASATSSAVVPAASSAVVEPAAPSTVAPTASSTSTVAPTTSSTVAPTTSSASTVAPTTSSASTVAPTTSSASTVAPATPSLDHGSASTAVAAEPAVDTSSTSSSPDGGSAPIAAAAEPAEAASSTSSSLDGGKASAPAAEKSVDAVVSKTVRFSDSSVPAASSLPTGASKTLNPRAIMKILQSSESSLPQLNDAINTLKAAGKNDTVILKIVATSKTKDAVSGLLTFQSDAAEPAEISKAADTLKSLGYKPSEIISLLPAGFVLPTDSVLNATKVLQSEDISDLGKIADAVSTLTEAGKTLSDILTNIPGGSTSAMSRIVSTVHTILADKAEGADTFDLTAVASDNMSEFYDETEIDDFIAGLDDRALGGDSREDDILQA